ncbi:VOC family protein [Chitinophaga skermanii]|nr:VOC family protein [Chitinophaga skermanii]
MQQPFLGLRTTIYKVTDMQAAKDWYSRVFDTIPYFDEPFYIGFNIGGYELGLQPVNEVNVLADNVVTYWGVEDAVGTYERLISLGAEPHETPQNVGGEIVVASVRDPWNNVLGVIYNPEFKVEP